MILSEWRLNIHFFSVHCNLLNVDTPKRAVFRPIFNQSQKEVPINSPVMLLNGTETYIHVYHTFKGPQWHNNEPIDNEVLGITNNFLYYS